MQNENEENKIDQDQEQERLAKEADEIASQLARELAEEKLVNRVDWLGSRGDVYKGNVLGSKDYSFTYEIRNLPLSGDRDFVWMRCYEPKKK